MCIWYMICSPFIFTLLSYVIVPATIAELFSQDLENRELFICLGFYFFTLVSYVIVPATIAELFSQDLENRDLFICSGFYFLLS